MLQLVQTEVEEQVRHPTRVAEHATQVDELTVYPVRQVVQTVLLEQTAQLLSVTLQYWQEVPDSAYPELQAQTLPLAPKLPAVLQLVHTEVEEQVMHPVIRVVQLPHPVPLGVKPDTQVRQLDFVLQVRQLLIRALQLAHKLPFMT